MINFLVNWLITSFLNGLFFFLVMVFILYWFYYKDLPIQQVPVEPQFEPFSLSASLKDMINNNTDSNKDLIGNCDGVIALNMIFQFLFQELKDTKAVRRYIIRKMTIEFKELLSTKAASKIVQRLTARDFSLGTSFPVFHSLKVQSYQMDKAQKTIQELSVIVDLEYKNGFSLSVDADLILGRSAYVHIKIVSIKGKARLQFTRNPFTHWSFAFVEEPEIEFSATSHFDGRQIPQLTSLLLNQLRRSVRRKHTLPNYKCRFKPFFDPVYTQNLYKAHIDEILKNSIINPLDSNDSFKGTSNGSTSSSDDSFNLRKSTSYKKLATNDDLTEQTISHIQQQLNENNLIKLNINDKAEIYGAKFTDKLVYQTNLTQKSLLNLFSMNNSLTNSKTNNLMNNFQYRKLCEKLGFDLTSVGQLVVNLKACDRLPEILYSLNIPQTNQQQQQLQQQQQQQQQQSQQQSGSTQSQQTQSTTSTSQVQYQETCIYLTASLDTVSMKSLMEKQICKEHWPTIDFEMTKTSNTLNIGLILMEIFFINKTEVVIQKILPNTFASSLADIKPFDIVYSINQVRINSIKQFNKIVQKAALNSLIKFTLQRPCIILETPILTSGSVKVKPTLSDGSAGGLNQTSAATTQSNGTSSSNSNGGVNVSNNNQTVLTQAPSSTSLNSTSSTSAAPTPAPTATTNTTSSSSSTSSSSLFSNSRLKLERLEQKLKLSFGNSSASLVPPMNAITYNPTSSSDASNENNSVTINSNQTTSPSTPQSAQPSQQPVLFNSQISTNNSQPTQQTTTQPPSQQQQPQPQPVPAQTQQPPQPQPQPQLQPQLQSQPQVIASSSLLVEYFCSASECSTGEPLIDLDLMSLLTNWGATSTLDEADTSNKQSNHRSQSYKKSREIKLDKENLLSFNNVPIPIDEIYSFDLNQNTKHLNIFLWTIQYSNKMSKMKNLLIGYISLPLNEINVDCWNTSKGETQTTIHFKPIEELKASAATRLRSHVISDHPGFDSSISIGSLTINFQHKLLKNLNNQPISQQPLVQNEPTPTQTALPETQSNETTSLNSNSDIKSVDETSKSSSSTTDEISPSLSLDDEASLGKELAEKIVDELIEQNKLETELNQRLADGQINLTNENDDGSVHKFATVQFNEGISCEFCNKKIWLKNAYQCVYCGYKIHLKCYEKTIGKTICARFYSKNQNRKSNPIENENKQNNENVKTNESDESFVMVTSPNNQSLLTSNMANSSSSTSINTLGGDRLKASSQLSVMSSSSDNSSPRGFVSSFISGIRHRKWTNNSESQTTNPSNSNNNSQLSTSSTNNIINKSSSFLSALNLNLVNNKNKSNQTNTNADTNLNEYMNSNINNNNNSDDNSDLSDSEDYKDMDTNEEKLFGMNLFDDLPLEERKIKYEEMIDKYHSNIDMITKLKLEYEKELQSILKTKPSRTKIFLNSSTTNENLKYLNHQELKLKSLINKLNQQIKGVEFLLMQSQIGLEYCTEISLHNNNNNTTTQQQQQNLKTIKEPLLIDENQQDQQQQQQQQQDQQLVLALPTILIEKTELESVVSN